MTTDGLPVAYRGENRYEPELRYLSITSDEDKQPPSGQPPDKPSDTETVKAGRQLYRPSLQMSKILRATQSIWRSNLAKNKAKDAATRSTSIKLAKGERLESTSIRNDHEDIILEQEDVRQ